jgi:hypothetical protein
VAGPVLTVGRDNPVSGVTGGRDQTAPVAAVQPSLTLSKAPARPIDLDDVERQLRDVASSLPLKPSSSREKGDDALAELAVLAPGG